jgi:hypothetical protein
VGAGHALINLLNIGYARWSATTSALSRHLHFDRERLAGAFVGKRSPHILANGILNALDVFLSPKATAKLSRPNQRLSQSEGARMTLCCAQRRRLVKRQGVSSQSNSAGIQDCHRKIAG